MKSASPNRFLYFLFLMLAGSATVTAQTPNKDLKTQVFLPSDSSLRHYVYPSWFRDAKFGIWAHWGPQAVPRQGDWYARKMYQEGSSDYKYHLKHYGHPSAFGYKDIIPLWKAERWNPEQLMKLYKRAGAKYFVSMGSHHDNFFLWNSSLHPWNAVNYGPHQDVVKRWQDAARAEGLKFGVSEHLGASFTWFQPSHTADTSGPMAGIPYDGANPLYQDLYHAAAAPDDKGWLSKNKEWQREWLFSIKELIDQYHPDLLYSDSRLPFDEVGRSMLAYYYNQDMKQHNAMPQVVYTCKEASDGRWVEDLERGVQDTMSLFPWQTDTSIGDWYYREGQHYKSAQEVISLLADIVSKNGNLLLNIVQTPEGDLEQDVLDIVNSIADWMELNGEGIFFSRPWKVYGEGPSTIRSNQQKGHFGGLSDEAPFAWNDIRFTTRGNELYVYCLGKPEADILIKSLAKQGAVEQKRIKSVMLLGSNQPIKWKQTRQGLLIKNTFTVPVAKVPIPGFKVSFE